MQSKLKGFDIHESQCGNGASLDFKCLPLLLPSAVEDRVLHGERDAHYRWRVTPTSGMVRLPH